MMELKKSVMTMSYQTQLYYMCLLVFLLMNISLCNSGLAGYLVLPTLVSGLCNPSSLCLRKLQMDEQTDRHYL